MSEASTPRAEPSSRVAIARLESRRHVRGAAVLSAVLSVFAILYVAIFPDMKAEAAQIVEILPAFLLEMFGLEALDTIEGFIAAEMYSFFWTVLVGAYFAYLGAGMIAVDVHDRRMDLTLANPVSRESVVGQKVAALWAPLAILNFPVWFVIVAGSTLVGEPVDVVALAMVHVLSIPYLLACAGLGLVLSVVLGHPRRSRGAAVAMVILLWLIDTVSRLSPDSEWIGWLTPSRYYAYTAILVRNEYDLVNAVALLVGALALVGLATALFVRRDI
ncbi:MAG: ABC transporter permease subunit [Halobacteriales archaeon]